MAALRAEGVPAAPSVHHSIVPDDPQVVARDLLRHYRHPAAGRFVQVGHPALALGGRAGCEGAGADAGSGAAATVATGDTVTGGDEAGRS